TVKLTATAVRLTLPGSTMPPMRKVRPAGASCAATCVGLKKNTRFWLSAASTSAVATPSAATPRPMARNRLCLGFTSLPQEKYFKRQADERHAVRTPDVQPIPAHGENPAHPASPLSSIMRRTRVSVTAMLYIQNASVMSSIPVSICAAMVGALVKLTDAPWCSVFHH